LGWTSNCSASCASVRSPLIAASATFALKAAVWFRRGRLFMVSPDSQAIACPLSGRNSTYRPVQISGATSEFVPRKEIDEVYNIRPYYIAPDGKVGQDAFVVIRSIIEQMKMVAIGRVVLTSREHVMAMEPRGKGLMGTLLRY